MTMTQNNDQSELINEYIKNLAAKVNELQAENILLKTRLSLLETANVAKAQEQQVQDGGDFGAQNAPKEEVAPTPAPEPMKVNQRPGSQKKRDVSGQFIEEK
jgi:hypothetical protein